MSRRPVPPQITDAAGRAWQVYEFSIHAGKVNYFDVGSGSGAYRGFVPVDGGARRRRLMRPGEEKVLVSPGWLLEQLQLSTIDTRDDPAKGTPERVDPEPTPATPPPRTRSSSPRARG